MAETERIIESDVDENARRQHLARYEFARTFVEDKSILDVACGSGYGTDYLARSTRHKGITGVDVSAEAVEYAKAHYERPGLQYRLGDALQLGQYKGTEAVVSLETIEHLHNPERFLEEVVRVLPPSGTFIVSTPNRATGTLQDKPRNPYHVREWSRVEFRQLLSQYFHDVEFYDQFLYVAKQAYPASRTIANLILKTLKPPVTNRLESWDVTPEHTNGIPLVKLLPRYVVAVCRRPKTI